MMSGVEVRVDNSNTQIVNRVRGQIKMLGYGFVRGVFPNVVFVLVNAQSKRVHGFANVIAFVTNVTCY